MQERWSLDALYTGLESPAFAADRARLEELIATIQTQREKSADIEELTRRLLMEEELGLLAYRILAWLSLRTSADTKDQEAENLAGQLYLQLTAIRASEVALTASIAEFEPFEALLARPELTNLTHRLERRRNAYRHNLSAAEEELAAELNLSGGDAWERLFDQLTANLQISLEKEDLNLSAVRNLAYDSDPAKRKAAYEAELAAYPQVAVPLSFALSSIKRQVKLMSRRRGYESPLAEALDRSDMSQATLDALLGAMRQKLSVFRRYLRAKAKYLGHEGALPWWDMFAPVGESSRHYSLEEARDFLVESFSKLHQPIADLMDEAFANDWIDFLPRPGKVGGAFCSNLPMIKQSRILSNFDGSFNAVDTLAHELGHAYHGKRVEGHRPSNWDYSMPVAETASTFNETHLTLMALEQATSREEKLALLEGVLMNTCQTIVDIYSRFRFEQKAFELCEQGRLTPEDCCRLMHEAQLEAYGDAITEESLHPYMWACKGHYYSAGLSYYNFPYAFGALLAMGLYSRYQQDPAFMTKYDSFLTMTTVASVEDTAASVGIDLTQEDFWLAGLNAFEKLVEQFEALA